MCIRDRGFVSLPFRGAYNASKYAIEGLSDTLRLELRGTNIYVSLIEPGPIASQFRMNAVKALAKYIDIENLSLIHISEPTRPY